MATSDTEGVAGSDLVRTIWTLFPLGFLLLTLLVNSMPQVAAGEEVFRLNTQVGLESFDPADSSNSIASFTLNIIYSPLMRYQNKKLSPNGAKSCQAIQDRHYRCELRKDWKWSDGHPVTADQFVFGFNELKRKKSLRLNNLTTLKSVVAPTPLRVDFFLTSPDSDFLYRLVDPALGPRRKDVDLKLGRVTYGPHRLKSKIPGRSFYFEHNPFYFIKKKTRPDVEVLIVDSDNTALNLYLTNKINFLRRLSTDKIQEFKTKPDFFQIPVHRFDYIGFGPQLNDYESLRKNLVYSLKPQYESFQKLFDALGFPGCFSALGSLVGQPLCYEDQKVKPYSDREILTLPLMDLYFTRQAGDDVQRAMELFQQGWKRQLNINVNLHPAELGVLNQMLRDNPPPLFRRGVPLERPTCLAALEVFESDNPNNFIRWSNKSYDSILAKMRKTTKATYSRLCKEGQKALLKAHRIIPLGEIHLSMLTDHNFDGILINELNQLDLSGLESHSESKETKP